MQQRHVLWTVTGFLGRCPGRSCNRKTILLRGHAFAKCEVTSVMLGYTVEFSEDLPGTPSVVKDQL